MVPQPSSCSPSWARSWWPVVMLSLLMRLICKVILCQPLPTNFHQVTTDQALPRLLSGDPSASFFASLWMIIQSTLKSLVWLILSFADQDQFCKAQTQVAFWMSRLSLKCELEGTDTATQEDQDTVQLTAPNWDFLSWRKGVLIRLMKLMKL